MTASTVADIIGHAERFMDDEAVRRDWADCALALAKVGTPAHDALDAYARARRSAPYWSPGRPGHNNHRHIPQPILANILGQARHCDECGKPFASANPRKRFCGGRCQRAAGRRREATL